MEQDLAQLARRPSLGNPDPVFGPAQQGDADEASHAEIVLADGPDFALVFLAILRIDNGSADPIVAVWMEVAHDDHAQNELILQPAGTLVAHVGRSAVGTDLGDLAKELAVHEVSVHAARGLAVAVHDLPVSDGALELLRELLRAGAGNRGQHQEDERAGGARFVSSRFQGGPPVCLDCRAGRPTLAASLLLRPRVGCPAGLSIIS